MIEIVMVVKIVFIVIMVVVMVLVVTGKLDFSAVVTMAIMISVAIYDVHHFLQLKQRWTLLVYFFKIPFA